MRKAKALRGHTLGFYEKGDIVEVIPDRYEGTLKVEVRKQGQVIARTTQPKRYFEEVK